MKGIFGSRDGHQYGSQPVVKCPHWRGELALFLGVALLLRLYVVWQTPLITRDGVLYVGMARMINHGKWLELVGDWFLFNPYPALIAWLARWGVDFEFAGQIISAVGSALAVIPLYFWCRSAFDRLTAQLCALTYVFHPVILRYSGHVLREGLFWFAMCWGVAAFWNAAERRSVWKFAFAGLLATFATLTRIEGATLFLLGVAWTLWPPPVDSSHPANLGSVEKPTWIGSLSRVGLACAMLPLTLIVLNMLFVPAGQGWRGGGRWSHLANQLFLKRDGIAKPQPIPSHMQRMVELEQARVLEQAPRYEDARALAKSLPVWNTLGEPDSQQLRLQRFLILAHDQRRFVFVGRFVNECVEGLLFPCVICCLWGFYYGFRKFGVWRRDLGLLIQGAALTLLLFRHVATEFVLEPRYMLCLIPLVFPWSCIGAQEIHRQLGVWFAAHPAWGSWRPRAVSLIAALMIFSLAKMQLGLDDRAKVYQRLLGVELQKLETHRLRMAGPERLKRIGHYADADYFIIPQGNVDSAKKWLEQQSFDVVLLSDEEPFDLSSNASKAAPIHQVGYVTPPVAYQRLFAEDVRWSGIRIYHSTEASSTK